MFEITSLEQYLRDESDRVLSSWLFRRSRYNLYKFTWCKSSIAFYTSLHSLCYIGYLLWVYSYMNG